MAMTAQRMRAEIPDFRNTDTAVIEAALADARLEVNSTVWGNRTDMGVKYKAAEIITDGSMGEQARLKKNEKVNIWTIRFNSLQRQVTMGLGRNT